MTRRISWHGHWHSPHVVDEVDAAMTSSLEVGLGFPASWLVTPMHNKKVGLPSNSIGWDG